MANTEIITIERLNEAVEDLANKAKKAFPKSYFGYAGIFPVDNSSSNYECTPINTKVFAMTGGNGVHYSILQISDLIQPVVMSVPMNYGNSIKNYNWVIGENLNEFLSLGYYNGWFSIEQLAYKIEWVLDYYSKNNSDEHSEAETHFILALKERFQYKHVPLEAARLKQLGELYFDKLKFDNEFIEQLNDIS